MRVFRCAILVVGFATLCDSRRKRPVSNADASKYLATYGYVGSSNVLNAMPRGLALDVEGTFDSLKSAIRKFQEFAGLRQSGELDDKTREKMAEPRCGVTDVLAITRSGSSAFKWNKNDLTYSIDAFSPDLPRDVIKQALAEALSKWSDVTPLTFREVPSGGDIKVKFGAGDHGDPWPFDGPGGVLAHATMPTNGLLHFDEDESWAYKDPRKISGDDYTDILAVAIHESGHALGLDHSRDETSIMAPFYQKTVDDSGHYMMPKLNAEDISRIQDIYGAGRGSAARPSSDDRPTTRIPSTTSSSRGSGSRGPSSGRAGLWDRVKSFFGIGGGGDSSSSSGSAPEPDGTSSSGGGSRPSAGGSSGGRETWVGSGECPNDVDAVTTVNGVTYVFSSTKVYEVGSGKVHSLKQLFPDSPAFVQGAVTSLQSGLTLLFQSGKVYGYSFDRSKGNFRLERSFPKRLPSALSFNPMGAFVWIDGHQTLLNANDFALYDENWNQATLQGKIPDYFPGFPREPIRGAVTNGNEITLFANEKVYKYDGRQKRVVGSPVSIRSFLRC